MTTTTALPRLDFTDTAINVPQSVQLSRSDKALLNHMSQARFGAPPTITTVFLAYVELPNGTVYKAEAKTHPDAVAKACRLAIEELQPKPK